jgi:hypothetical protein
LFTGSNSFDVGDIEHWKQSYPKIQSCEGLIQEFEDFYHVSTSIPHIFVVSTGWSDVEENIQLSTIISKMKQFERHLLDKYSGSQVLFVYTSSDLYWSDNLPERYTRNEEFKALFAESTLSNTLLFIGDGALEVSQRGHMGEGDERRFNVLLSAFIFKLMSVMMVEGG